MHTKEITITKRNQRQGTEHKELTKSTAELVAVKPHTLDQSNSKPMKSPRI
jgi:hypothetical protein